MSLPIKNILCGLLVASSISSLGFATNEIGCTQSVSPFSNCTAKYIYLSKDNNQNNLPDYAIVPKANYIYDVKPTKSYNLIQLLTTTNVEYYMSTGNMLYTTDSGGNLGVMDNTLFRLQSWVFEYNVPVRSIRAFRYVNIEVPSLTGIDNPTVGFKYNHILKKATGYNGSSVSDYRYRPVPSLSYFGEQGIEKLSVTNNTKRSRGDALTNSTCVNYTLQWCGDKKISTTTGYLLNNKFYPISSWVSTGFTPEICDSTTETGAACVNGTVGCCNTTCSGFGGANERCGDEKLQAAGTYYNNDPNDMSFEECDDGDATGDTDGVVNGDDPETHFCSSICLPTFTEAFVEVFINE